MFNLEEIEGNKITLPTYQLIILLESHLKRLKSLQLSDSSWNYSIEKLKKQIEDLEKTQ